MSSSPTKSSVLIKCSIRNTKGLAEGCNKAIYGQNECKPVRSEGGNTGWQRNGKEIAFRYIHARRMGKRAGERGGGEFIRLQILFPFAYITSKQQQRPAGPTLYPINYSARKKEEDNPTKTTSFCDDFCLRP
jgi:hypothetical protein